MWLTPNQDVQQRHFHINNRPCPWSNWNQYLMTWITKFNPLHSSVANYLGELLARALTKKCIHSHSISFITSCLKSKVSTDFLSNYPSTRWPIYPTSLASINSLSNGHMSVKKSDIFIKCELYIAARPSTLCTQDANWIPHSFSSVSLSLRSRLLSLLLKSESCSQIKATF